MFYPCWCIQAFNIIWVPKIGDATARITLNILKALAVILAIAAKRFAVEGEDLKLNHVKLQQFA